MTNTIRDVAKLAGVSTPTVSRVLGNKENVDPVLRQRVVDAVRQLNYRPHRAARALRSQVSRSIAFIIPDIQNPFFTSVLRGVEDAAFVDDYVVMLCNTDDSQDRQKGYIDVLMAENVAGIVLCPADETRSLSQVQSMQEQGIAVVVVDRQVQGAALDTVMLENAQAAQEAMRYLVDLGHTRIGIISGPDYYAPGRERLLGYERALAEAGIPVDRELVRKTDFRPDAATTAARALLSLSLELRPTAIFATSSRLSLAALAVLGEAGVRIPDEISFVGFDDADWARSYRPQLTVVAQPTYEIGARACRRLLERIANPSLPPETVRLPAQLLVRRSCTSVHRSERARAV